MEYHQLYVDKNNLNGLSFPRQNYIFEPLVL